MALRDPRIGEALAAIHCRLERDWDVSALAKRAGMSRTAFAIAFAELVGEPPAHYLARCRMNEAAALLETSTATIAQIAEPHLDLHDILAALSELSDTKSGHARPADGGTRAKLESAARVETSAGALLDLLVGLAPCAAPLTCVPK